MSLLVIFKESWIQVYYGGKLRQGCHTVDSCHEIKKTASKQNTILFIITNHRFFEPIVSPTRTLRARKNSIAKSKHRQQRNVSETETGPLFTDLSASEIPVPVNQDIPKYTKSWSYNYTLLDITHAFCHRCVHYLAALSRRIRGRSVERSCPLRKVDKRACSFLLWNGIYVSSDWCSRLQWYPRHKPPNRPNSWKATELLTGLVGSSSLLLSHSHTNARSYTVPH